MINVRKTKLEDIDFIYQLASSVDVREASFTTHEINYNEHEKWFHRIINSKNEFLYVLFADGEFAGQIRYTFSEDDYNCIVGISLAKEKRNKNLAVPFFIRSLFLLKKEKENIQTISAYIKINNYQSIGFFKKAGFIYNEQTSIKGVDAQHWLYKVNKTFIIAELSANHKQNIEIAKETIKAIKESGADAVKIQTYTADTITINCKNDYFKIKQGTIWDGRNLYDLYNEAYTPWEWHDELRDCAESIGLMFFSTPFDVSAVDFLEKKKAPIYKIASFEITDLPLIKYTASKMKPMIISTGIATINEIMDAVEICKKAGNNDIMLLKCTSSYPAPVEEANLKTMVNMKETFNVKVGLSDHTMGSDVAVAAVALGAEVIEKHFILDRRIGGPDAGFSMEPAEFKAMVNSIRNVEKALGRVTYELSEKSLKSREFSRSLFVVKDMRAGDKFTEDNVRSIRPGYGIAPKLLNKILGRSARVEIKNGTPLRWELFE